MAKQNNNSKGKGKNTIGRGGKPQKSTDVKKASETIKLNDDLMVQVVYGVRDVDEYLDYVIENYYDKPKTDLDVHQSLSDFSKACRSSFKIKTTNALVLPVYKHKSDRVGYEKYKKIFIRPLPTPEEVAEANKSEGDEMGAFMEGIESRMLEINNGFKHLMPIAEQSVPQEEQIVIPTPDASENELVENDGLIAENDQLTSEADQLTKENKQFVRDDLAKKQIEALKKKVVSLVDDLKQSVSSGSQSADTAKLKRENARLAKSNKELSAELIEKRKKLSDAIDENDKLTKKNKDLEATVKQKDADIVKLKEESKEFNERAVILKSGVQDALENAYDLQKDISAAQNLADSLFPKCKDLDPAVIKQVVGAVAKFREAIAKCKNYGAYTSELRNIAFKGIIMKGSDLYEKMKDNIDNKETWLSILNSELFRFDVGGAIVMCEDIAIRLARMFPNVNLSGNKFAELAASIREKGAKLGLKIDSAKPYASATNTEDWQAVEFIAPHDGLDDGQVAEVLHLGVRYGNSQDKTTYISVMS